MMIAIMVVCAGALVFAALRRDAKQMWMATASEKIDLQTGRDHIAATEEKVSRLLGDVLEKKNRLRQTTRPPQISAELLSLVEGDRSKDHRAAWAELRKQLDIGWDSSPDYVLVNKQILKRLQYERFSSEDTSEEANDLLGLSPAEQSSLRSVLDHVRASLCLKVVRTEPKGDVVAQYSVPVPDPVFNQSVSNQFAAEIAGVVGQERVEMLLPDAWHQVRSSLGVPKPETMTIRRSMVDGEPDLICEMKRGDEISTSPVRFARYPLSWLTTLFPGGWEELAQREGFDLPERFQPK
jgi:hypothetical protein